MQHLHVLLLAGDWSMLGRFFMEATHALSHAALAAPPAGA